MTTPIVPHRQLAEKDSANAAKHLENRKHYDSLSKTGELNYNDKEIHNDYLPNKMVGPGAVLRKDK